MTLASLRHKGASLPEILRVAAGDPRAVICRAPPFTLIALQRNAVSLELYLALAAPRSALLANKAARYFVWKDRGAADRMHDVRIWQLASCGRNDVARLAVALRVQRSEW